MFSSKRRKKSPRLRSITHERFDAAALQSPWNHADQPGCPRIGSDRSISARPNCPSGTGTLPESVKHGEQTGAPDAPSDRILLALTLRTERPPCEGPTGTPWHRGRYHARPHRIILGTARRRRALFKTGNRPVPDRGRGQGVRRRLNSISPRPYSPRPSLPSSCLQAAGALTV